MGQSICKPGYHPESTNINGTDFVTCVKTNPDWTGAFIIIGVGATLFVSSLLYAYYRARAQNREHL